MMLLSTYRRYKNPNTTSRKFVIFPSFWRIANNAVSYISTFSIFNFLRKLIIISRNTSWSIIYSGDVLFVAGKRIISTSEKTARPRLKWKTVTSKHFKQVLLTNSKYLEIFDHILWHNNTLVRWLMLQKLVYATFWNHVANKSRGYIQVYCSKSACNFIFRVVFIQAKCRVRSG